MNNEFGDKSVSGQDGNRNVDDAPLDLHADAGEYVIGTLAGEELERFQGRIDLGERNATDAVAYWERRLGAMNDWVTPVEPSKGLAERVMAALPDLERPFVAANDNPVLALQKSRNRWRMGAIAAAVMAAALGAIAFDDTLRARLQPGATEQRVADTSKDETRLAQPAGESFVAVVSAQGDQPALIVSVDTATNEVTVRSLGIDAPAGKSLELWYVPEGGTPVSAGLIGVGEVQLPTERPSSGATLAVSLEPEGGSPEGVATGPVIYSGKLVRDDSGN